MLKLLTLRRFWNITAIVVIFQLAFAQAMAASPELHHSCDSHSDVPGHECVVTLMQTGGYSVVLPDILPEDVSPETPPVPVANPIVMDLLPSHLAGGVLAHAPPRGP